MDCSLLKFIIIIGVNKDYYSNDELLPCNPIFEIYCIILKLVISEQKYMKPKLLFIYCIILKLVNKNT